MAILTPASRYRMPAEWEPVESIWLVWPDNVDTWPGRYNHVLPTFTRFVRRVAERTRVQLLVCESQRAIAQHWLRNIAGVRWHAYATNDCWIRDYGPTFVHRADDGAIAGVDWRYNAWGGKYPPWDRDAAAARWILKQLGVPRVSSKLTLEGGALETDGAGRLLTTRSCLLSEARNPGWDESQVAVELHRCLGVTEIVWLDRGALDGDDTDGHIDQLARFVDRNNLVAAVSSDPDDPNAQGLQTSYEQLRCWGRQSAPPVDVHRLPTPPPRWIDGQRVPESYCNFLFLGAERLLVPQFRQWETDRVALTILRRLLPRTEVIGVDAADLVWGLGALHCASQQQPRAGKPRQA